MSIEWPGAASTAPAVVSNLVRGADMAQVTCSVDGCERTNVAARGLCEKHYQRWYRATPADERPVVAVLPRPVTDEAVRFWSKVDRSGDGCWEWMGSRTRLGYGSFRVPDGTSPAHRVAWRLTNGPIPEGMNALHRCDNRPCVRVYPPLADGAPDPRNHLFLGSQLDNVRDAVGKGRHRPPKRWGGA